MAGTSERIQKLSEKGDIPRTSPGGFAHVEHAGPYGGSDTPDDPREKR